MGSDFMVLLAPSKCPECGVKAVYWDRCEECGAVFEMSKPDEVDNSA